MGECNCKVTHFVRATQEYVCQIEVAESGLWTAILVSGIRCSTTSGHLEIC